MDFQETLKQAFQSSANNLKALAENDGLQKTISQVAHRICELYGQGGSIFACGNGGSAADSQHFIAELVSKLSKDREPIRGFAMTTDTSILTAIGNDYGYDLVFHRQVKGLMRSKDVLLAITTSGNSPNVKKALEACREIGATSILLSGREGGTCRELADHVILAPGKTTAEIQEAHLVIYHNLCYLIEKGLVQSGHVKYV